MFAGLAAACVPGSWDAYVGLGERRAHVRASPHMATSFPLALLVADPRLSLCSGVGAGRQEIIDPGSAASRRRGRVVAGDHDCAMAISAQLGERCGCRL